MDEGQACKSMHRVPPALKKAAKYPLTQRLDKIKKGPHNQRIQVVSPELCEDALLRLEPTLKSHVGCDIIDINPGVCLWSAKVHELLKPRRHILVEPFHNVYDPFLRPLVNTPGSRYTLADLSGPWDRWNLGDYIAKGLLPEQAHLEEPGLDTSIGNTTLLVLVNMSRLGRPNADRSTGRKTADSHYKVLEFVRTLETRSGFHSKGAVRMLMWMIDQEKSNLLPRTVASRRRLSVYNELSCDVEEIVGDVLGPHATRREAHIDIQSSLLTAKRMKKNGIVVSTERMDELPRSLRSEDIDVVIQSTHYGDSVIHGERIWHKELHELREGFANGSYSQFVGGPPGYNEKIRKLGDMATTPEYKKFQLLVRTEKDQRKKKAAVDNILREEAQIRAMQLKIASNGYLGDAAHEKEIEELGKLTDQYRNLLARQTNVRLNSVHFFADDRVAWSGDSSLLLWDHRNAEPIVPQANEFHNPKSLALLDFQPKISSSHILTTVQQKYLDDILLSCFTTPGASVETALNSMAPGAAEAIIPNAPSLRDPRRGGRMDLDQLRVRVLTLGMLREIAVAWDGWLFKPTLPEISQTIPWVDHDAIK
ncbi:hypothetical protein MMC18_004544 [Xylographa bjoerkii]|nr:hypothetical protein [Xylographa bjoerkii]